MGGVKSTLGNRAACSLGRIGNLEKRWESLEKVVMTEKRTKCWREKILWSVHSSE